MSKKKTPAATPAKPKAAKPKAAPQGADVAPAKGTATTKPTPAAKAPKAPKPFEVAAAELFGNDAEAAAAHGIRLGKGKAAKPVPTPKPTTTEASIAAPAKKEGKGATILQLIGRDQGATLAEIMNATCWLPHSVRGFVRQSFVSVPSAFTKTSCFLPALVVYTASYIVSPPRLKSSTMPSFPSPTF